VTLKRPATLEQVRAALAAGPGLQVVDNRAGNRFPTPLKASGGDPVLVGAHPAGRDAGRGEGGRGMAYGGGACLSRGTSCARGQR